MNIDRDIILISLFLAFLIFSTISIFAIRFDEEKPYERHHHVRHH